MLNEIHLRQISDRDPDGWETRPTIQDHYNFMTWVVKNYGDQGWKEYKSYSPIDRRDV